MAIGLYVAVGIIALSDRTPKVYLPTTSYVTPQGVRVTVDNDRVAPSATCFRVVITNKFSPYLIANSDTICTSTINPGEQADLPVPMSTEAIATACTYSQDPWSNCSLHVENVFAAPEHAAPPTTATELEGEAVGRSGVSTAADVPSEVSVAKP